MDRNCGVGEHRSGRRDTLYAIMATRNFADISSNNGPNALDAAEYAKAGHVLLAIKATQGTAYTNPYWASQAKQAHEHHVGVVHYHYAAPEQVGMQADRFLAALKSSGAYDERYDAVALDIERGQAIADPIGFVDAFDETCRKAGHRNLIVYTELSYHEEHGLAPRNGRLWLADYDAGFLNGCWADQYSDSASVHGISGPCDVSRLSMAAYLYHLTHLP